MIFNIKASVSIMGDLKKGRITMAGNEKELLRDPVIQKAYMSAVR